MIDQTLLLMERPLPGDEAWQRAFESCLVQLGLATDEESN